MSDYVAVNLANWNSRVPHHEQAYGLEQFRADPAHLSNAVRFDLARLGSIDGLDVVHLQCHIGTDTLVGWAWAPGFGRKPAPGTQQEAGALADAWVKTGAVCPN